MLKAEKQSYRIIGLMSGSSLDGVDIACCTFEKKGDSWSYHLLHTACVAYTDSWLLRLRAATSLSGKVLWQLHTDIGRLYGEMVASFVTHHSIKDVDAIASHGHTVFHFPEQGYTTQIGCGATIAAVAGLPVVCDFRSADVALGGQGTPIVPIGDKLLFADYDYLLNIGGIANLTIKNGDRIIAFDICAANQVLNYYAAMKGADYDKDGAWAASGTVHQPLFDTLNALPYYQRSAPKSLDNSYSRDIVLPIIDSYDISLEDKLNTYCAHIAEQIARQIGSVVGDATLKHQQRRELMITGGGAFNKYLIQCIAARSPIAPHLPSAEIITYKEALVIALMGALRLRGEVNVLSSVTGARQDSCGGAVYGL